MNRSFKLFQTARRFPVARFVRSYGSAPPANVPERISYGPEFDNIEKLVENGELRGFWQQEHVEKLFKEGKINEHAVKVLEEELAEQKEAMGI
jgi:hypothetical protein